MYMARRLPKMVVDQCSGVDMGAGARTRRASIAIITMASAATSMRATSPAVDMGAFTSVLPKTSDGVPLGERVFLDGAHSASLEAQLSFPLAPLFPQS